MAVASRPALAWGSGEGDLGGDLSANFLLENGFNSDTGSLGQGDLLFGRQMYVGLSGNFGAVRLGRQYSPYYLVLRDVTDPFAAGPAGRAGNIMATNTRVNNMSNYITPKFGGFFAELAYGLGEAAGDAQQSRTIEAAISYEQGAPRCSWRTISLIMRRLLTGQRITLFTARYDFGIANGSFGYAINTGTGPIDRKALF